MKRMLREYLNDSYKHHELELFLRRLTSDELTVLARKVHGAVYCRIAALENDCRAKGCAYCRKDDIPF